MVPWLLHVVPQSLQLLPEDAPASFGTGGQGALWSWVPWDCNNLKDSSWHATTTRALYKNKTETHPWSLFKRGLFAYLGASEYGAGFQFSTHLGDCRCAFRGCRPVHAICAVSLTTAHWYPQTRALTFVTAAQGTLLVHLALVARVVVPQYCIYCIFKELLPEGLAYNQPESRSSLRSWDTDRSWHNLK